MISSHEAARALLAMEPFMLAKIPVPTKAASAKEKYPKPPESPFAIRVAALFGRKADRLWFVPEVEAFKALLKAYTYDPADMDMIEAYYKSERAKGRAERGGGIHRSDLVTFVRHFGQELDRARAYHEAKAKRGTRFDPKPSNIVELPQPEPVSEEEARQKFRQSVSL
jgi:hypothetical protein